MSGEVSSSILGSSIRDRPVFDRKHDAHVIFKPRDESLDVCGWVHSVISPAGRPIIQLFVPTTFVTLVSIIWTLASETDVFGPRYSSAGLNRLATGYSGIFLCVSFLVIFRLNRSAVRYYEGRQAAGIMIVAARELACLAHCNYAHDEAF